MVTPPTRIQQALYSAAATLTSPICWVATKTLERLGSSFLVNYAPKYDYPTLHELLDAWLQNPRVTGNKAEAVKRITQAYQDRSGTLDLRNLDLNQLPPGLKLLSLTTLNVSYNRLTSLAGLVGCTNLRYLLVRNNQLATLKPLVHCTQLLYLCVEDNLLRSLEGLEGCTDLYSLEANQNQLETLKSLAHCTQLQWLYVGYNLLTSLAGLEGCTNLKKLYADNNQFTTLTHLARCTQLQDLSVSRNRLTSLAGLEGCTNLKKLYADQNQLNSPEPLAHCSQLQELNVSHNNLRSLSGIHECLELSTLNIQFNRYLNTLPLNPLPLMTQLDAAGTSIPDALCDAFFDACSTARNSLAADRLPSLLTLWERYAGLPPGTLNLQLDTQEKGHLHEWLIRLAKAKDFSTRQRELAKTVCSLLQSVSDPEFKKIFFIQVEANNECCEDRAAMALNELYLAEQLLLVSGPAALLLLSRAAKTLALRAAISQRISAQEKKRGRLLEEGVEIYLYYETQLGLLTAVRSMGHGDMGKVDWIDEEQLKGEVEASYFEHMVLSEACERLLLQDTTARPGFEAIQTEFGEKLEQIGDCPPGKDTDIQVLNWNHAMGACRQERDAALTQYKRDWLWRQSW